MLYLLRSFGEGGISILKVGYAKDYKLRLAQYKLHNPYIKEISQRDGDLVDEAKLHLYLHHLGFGELGNEWYKDCQEVIDIFNEPMDEIDAELWKNRSSIFTRSLLDNESSGSIYSQLFNKNTISVFSEKEINGNIVKDFVGEDIDLQYISMTEFRQLENKMCEISSADYEKTEEDKLLLDIIGQGNFPERMEYIYNLDEDRSKLLDNVFNWLPFYYGNFYRSVTPEEAKRLSYRKGELEKRYDRSMNNQQVDTDKLRGMIYREFKVGSRYTKSYIKDKLGEIYNDCGYIRTPKANDLEEYFELSPCLVPNKTTGKRDNGFEILKKK